jgi:hypothetical protein
MKPGTRAINTLWRIPDVSQAVRFRSQKKPRRGSAILDQSGPRRVYILGGDVRRQGLLCAFLATEQASQSNVPVRYRTNRLAIVICKAG